MLLLVEYSAGELVDPTTTLEQVKKSGGDRPQVVAQATGAHPVDQRQQSADHGTIVRPLSDTSDVASMVERAVHFVPPGNSASWAYNRGT